jgi:hypothetical protein
VVEIVTSPKPDAGDNVIAVPAISFVIVDAGLTEIVTSPDPPAGVAKIPVPAVILVTAPPLSPLTEIEPSGETVMPEPALMAPITPGPPGTSINWALLRGIKKLLTL